jgi:hypothetical protein
VPDRIGGIGRRISPAPLSGRRHPLGVSPSPEIEHSSAAAEETIRCQGFRTFNRPRRIGLCELVLPVPSREHDGMASREPSEREHRQHESHWSHYARSGRRLARLSARTHFGNDHVSEAGQCCMAGEEVLVDAIPDRPISH